MAFLWCKCKAYVVNDSGSNGRRVRGAMLSQDVGQSNDKEQRTQGITLCHAFLQGVGNNIVHGEGLGRVGSKVNAWGLVVEETEPCSEDGTVNKLNSVPDILSENIIEGFFKVTGHQSAAKSSRSLGSLDKLLTTSRHRDAKVKTGYEAKVAGSRQGFLHHKKRGNANKSLRYTEIPEFNSGARRIFVEQTALEVGGPVAEPGERSTSKVLDESAKYRPIGVRVLVLFKGGRQPSEQLDPREAKAGDAGG